MRDPPSTPPKGPLPPLPSTANLAARPPTRRPRLDSDTVRRLRPLIPPGPHPTTWLPPDSPTLPTATEPQGPVTPASRLIPPMDQTSALTGDISPSSRVLERQARTQQPLPVAGSFATNNVTSPNTTSTTDGLTDVFVDAPSEPSARQVRPIRSPPWNKLVSSSPSFRGEGGLQAMNDVHDFVLDMSNPLNILSLRARKGAAAVKYLDYLKRESRIPHELGVNVYPSRETRRMGTTVQEWDEDALLKALRKYCMENPLSDVFDKDNNGENGENAGGNAIAAASHIYADVDSTPTESGITAGTSFLNSADDSDAENYVDTSNNTKAASEAVKTEDKSSVIPSSNPQSASEAGKIEEKASASPSKDGHKTLHHQHGTHKAAKRLGHTQEQINDAVIVEELNKATSDPKYSVKQPKPSVGLKIDTELANRPRRSSGFFGSIRNRSNPSPRDSLKQSLTLSKRSDSSPETSLARSPSSLSKPRNKLQKKKPEKAVDTTNRITTRFAFSCIGDGENARQEVRVRGYMRGRLAIQLGFATDPPHAGPFDVNHPNHPYTWLKRNRQCLSCKGKCPLCGNPCCAYKSASTEDRAAIEKYFGPATDESTFVKCVYCAKEVCPQCARRCRGAFCGMIICEKCEEEGCVCKQG